MLEKAVEQHLVRGVKALRGFCWKLTVPGVRGVPDRLCLLPGGNVVFVELKRPKGGRLSVHQKLLHSVMRGLGLRVEVFSTKEEVDSFLEEFT